MYLFDVLRELRPVLVATSVGSAWDRDLLVLATTYDTALAKRLVRDLGRSATRAAGTSSASAHGEAQAAVLRCLRDVLKATLLTGPENLPDVPLPAIRSQRVAECGPALDEFGRTLLAAAEAVKDKEALVPVATGA